MQPINYGPSSVVARPRAPTTLTDKRVARGRRSSAFRAFRRGLSRRGSPGASRRVSTHSIPCALPAPPDVSGAQQSRFNDSSVTPPGHARSLCPTSRPFRAPTTTAAAAKGPRATAPRASAPRLRLPSSFAPSYGVNKRATVPPPPLSLQRPTQRPFNVRRHRSSRSTTPETWRYYTRRPSTSASIPPARRSHPRPSRRERRRPPPPAVASSEDIVRPPKRRAHPSTPKNNTSDASGTPFLLPPNVANMLGLFIE
uniref:Uncharacterized protein n=1 Tax=Plectus sambesii TaxID=2011161 RepID=A0A914WWU8_9BILA